MEETDQEKLIEIVRCYQSLYVMTHAKYNDNRFKEFVWIEIGKKMKQPAAVCKRAWTSLRDSYRKAVRKRRDLLRSGRVASRIRKWKFEDDMSFLKPHLQRQETYNVWGKGTADKNDEEDDEDSADDNDNSRNYYRDTNEDWDENLDTDDEDGYDNQRVNVEETTKRKATNREIVKPVTAPTKEKEQEIAPKSATIECTLENERRVNTEKREEPCSAIDTLFSSIASTVKTFSPYYQNIAKSRIFKIITDLEMEQIVKSRPEFEFANTTVPRRQTYAPLSAENLESYHSEDEPHNLPSTLNPLPTPSHNFSGSVWEETYHGEESIKKE